MALNLLSCLSGQKKEKLDIKWRPGINAPKYYPAELVSGGLYTNNKVEGYKSSGLTNGAFLNDGWGEGGAEMSTGHFVPEKLSIKWYSFAEDKFYMGDFKLPADTMRALFKQGFIDCDGDFFDYNWIVTNVYPKGGVALWMKVGGQRQVEIGHFQAEEIEYDGNSLYPDMTMNWSDFAKESMDDIKGAQKYLDKHGISQEPFKTTYRKRYNYTIEIDSISHAETEFILFQAYNGEQDVMEGEGLDNNFFKTKAVTKYIFPKWQKGGIKYIAKYYPNEEEILKAFADMSVLCPNQAFVLLLKPDYSTRKLKVILQSETETIELNKTGTIWKD